MSLFGKPLAESLVTLDELEARAEAQYSLSHNMRREIVGLGFSQLYTARDMAARRATELPEPEGPGLGMCWVELENVSPKADQHNEFRIDGSELRFVLQRAARVLGIDDRTKVEFTLWHSHYVGEGPSKRDVQAYPAWLAKSGIIYHAPTQASTRYNAAGVFPVGDATAGLPTTTGKE
jgi:hypothetical protein